MNKKYSLRSCCNKYKTRIEQVLNIHVNILGFLYRGYLGFVILILEFYFCYYSQQMQKMKQIAPVLENTDLNTSK